MNDILLNGVQPDFENFIPRDGVGVIRTKAPLVEAVTFEDEDPDLKLYLLLLVESGYESDIDECRSWELHIGRQYVFDYLKNLITAGSIDPDISFILSGKQPAEDALTIYRFMRICIDKGSVVCNTEEFDIDEYHNVYKASGEDYKLRELLEDL